MSIEYFIQQQTIDILLSIPWNFLQNRSYLMAQNNLSKYKKTEISPCILSDHNALRLELNNKNNSRIHTNNWRLKNTLLNHQQVIGEIREENKSFRKLMKMKTPLIRTYGTQQRQS
jgi:hypothetical protein